MLFKQQGDSVQVVRLELDRASQKRRTRLLGAFSLSKPEIGAELREACTEEELVEVERWIKAQDKIQALKAEVAALTLPDALTLATVWIAEADAVAARDMMAQATEAWIRLRHAAGQRNLV